MRAAPYWQDYELIDCGEKQRLERWGNIILVRPDPQAVWKPRGTNRLWKNADAIYHRSSSGGGSWEYKRTLPREWTVDWQGLRFIVSPTDFKHTGLFPEQAANWDLYRQKIINAGRPVRVLNLFGYTGGATVACLSAGAYVCHVDASKGMVSWAKRNVELNSLGGEQVRYIVDDCSKFVAREIRRGVRYDALIMDPPSYGRGPSGEVWRMEDNIYDLVSLCMGVLSDDPLFFALNSYTTGLAPSVCGYILSDLMKDLNGTVYSDEIGLPVTDTGLALPCGSTALFLSDKD